MGDAYRLAVFIDGGRGAGIWQPGVLGHRKRVHVGAEHHLRAVAVLQQANHTGDTDSARDGVAELLEVVCGNARGAMLLPRQLRMPVQVPVNLQQLRCDALDGRLQALIKVFM